jgi:hypothetical protein
VDGVKRLLELGQSETLGRHLHSLAALSIFSIVKMSRSRVALFALPGMADRIIAFGLELLLSRRLFTRKCALLLLSAALSCLPVLDSFDKAQGVEKVLSLIAYHVSSYAELCKPAVEELPGSKNRVLRLPGQGATTEPGVPPPGGAVPPASSNNPAPPPGGDGVMEAAGAVVAAAGGNLAAGQNENAGSGVDDDIDDAIAFLGAPGGGSVGVAGGDGGGGPSITQLDHSGRQIDRTTLVRQIIHHANLCLKAYIYSHVAKVTEQVLC